MFDRFKSYPVNRQVLLATCIGVIIFVLLVTAWLSLRTGYSPLFKDLRAPDAAAIIAELDKKKEPYRLADQGQTVLVPTDRVDATRLELMNGDLALKGTVGFELFNKSDMGLTDFAQKINFQRALQGELERTILTLDGVESTRVHLSLGENRIFREDRIPPKASVTIHMRQNAHLPAAAAAGVQRLIAAAVPQLEPTDVVILDEAGQIIATSLTPFGPSGPASNPVQDFYSARIRDALLPIYAEGDFQIAVKARPTSANAGRSVRLPSDAQSPQTRDYALDVTVAPSQSISNETKEDVKNLVAGAINFDPKRGDRIGFGPIAMSNDNLSVSAPAVLPQAFPAPEPTTPSSEAPATTIFPLGIWVVVMIAALTCLFVLAVRLFRGKPRMLSTADRERLIDTLNALVETEGGKNALRD